MFDRNSFSNEQYQQQGEFCVLASYGVAMKRFLTGQTTPDVPDFFRGYCEEMGCACKDQAMSAAMRWERLYLADFVQKTAVMSGYELIHLLHQNSDVAPFREARGAVGATPTGLDRNTLPAIEGQLKDQAKRLALICVNDGKSIPQTSPFAWAWKIREHHSLVVGCDGAGFYAYDVNHGGRLMSLGNSVEALVAGDCLLFTVR